MSERAARLREIFRADAREQIALLSSAALAIERGDLDAARQPALARAAHTLKGGASLLGLDAAGALAAEIEHALRQVPADPGRLLALLDDLTDAIWPPAAPERRPPLAAAAESSGASGPPSAPASTPPIAGPPSAPASAPTSAGRPSAPASTPTSAGPPSAPASTPLDVPLDGARTSTVRVRSDRIDALLGLVAEARRSAAGLVDRGGEGARHLVDLLDAAEDAALRLRLLPLGAIFGDLERAIRDAARAEAKQATLIVHGGDVEADASVVDAAAEIVIQLARNAVAHGIEPPSDRRAAAKPVVGQIELTIQARGGWLELALADDGRGIDEAAVRRQAVALGLDPTRPIVDLLFAPGLSTRAQADGLAGRGVGMDIVRARAQAAGGDVTARWQPGRGSVFEARLPVTALYERLVVATIDGALVGFPAAGVERVTGELPADQPGVVASAAEHRAGIEPVAGGLASNELLLPVGGTPIEMHVLTVPLGAIFARSPLTRRGWIAPDGRVGIVLELDWLAASPVLPESATPGLA